ncbi:MAG: sodium-dependent transporter [Candidatus Omnitrophica bacterium]|nr:sodium-dependent transporter [Candidatus Omnitrophota bacterium]
MAIKNRDAWGSRFGVIMAVAGSAIGLGNFLRFPGQAASNGGGAFLIPYFISLLFLGIPLMWIEWTIGRYGGGFGHSTAPGVFHTLWEKNRFIKYFGLIGIFGPLVIFIYYIYIESWTLAYSFFSITGRLSHLATQADMKDFLSSFQGLVRNEHFGSLAPAYIFFLATFVINMVVLYRGIRHGIERFCKIAMPILLIFAVFMLIRVFTLGVPNAARPSWNVINGLGFLWNPDFSALKDAKVWLAAAGQIFFTLSVGIGVILTYASYLKKGDDVALNGLSAVFTNEFAEVILGASIIIPAAFIFFGPIGTRSIAEGGIFNLGFVTMPLIVNKLQFSSLFGFMWFFLLFLAGVTSSISLSVPAVAFLEDEFNLTRRKAVSIFLLVSFTLSHLAILFLKNGVVDELDFWGGTFCLVLFATIETILFAWVFGIERAWEEIHHGSDIAIPRFYKFIIKYVTPLFLFAILGFWGFQKGRSVLFMEGIAAGDRPYIFMTRIILLALVLILAVLIKLSWRKKRLGLRQA